MATPEVQGLSEIYLHRPLFPQHQNSKSPIHSRKILLPVRGDPDIYPDVANTVELASAIAKDLNAAIQPFHMIQLKRKYPLHFTDVHATVLGDLLLTRVENYLIETNNTVIEGELWQGYYAPSAIETAAELTHAHLVVVGATSETFNTADRFQDDSRKFFTSILNNPNFAVAVVRARKEKMMKSKEEKPGILARMKNFWERFTSYLPSETSSGFFLPNLKPGKPGILRLNRNYLRTLQDQPRNQP